MLRLIAALVLVSGAGGFACHATPGGPLRFRITLARESVSAPVSGRMLVFMTSTPGEHHTLGAGWFDHNTWVAGQEYESIAPGESVEFDADVHAWPKPFSQAPRATYQFMALLDRDHDYNYYGQDADDLYSAVVNVADVDPAATAPVALLLSRREKPEAQRQAEGIEVVEYESPLLANFWGRPITMRAAVVLPPSYAKEPHRYYPAIYFHHGYTDDYREAYSDGRRVRRMMEQGKGMEAILVFLNGVFPSGDHEFADSVNNGPWGRALTEEFIPHLEHKYRLIARPSARFLTGHSSGGWASLWAQVTYPDFYGGTWSTAPDPVDFRSFTGIDVTPGSKDNAYRRPDGAPHYLARSHGKDLITLEDFAMKEQVLGEIGGQFESFEWVFSPRGPDGQPLKIFNRVTGDLNPEVKRAWQKYDIRLKLAENWQWLGPKLQGKLNIIVGGADTFHLEEPVSMLCDFLKSKRSDAVCEIVPGRDHMNLYESYKTYPNGLEERILREMTAKFQAANKQAAGGAVQ